jgi:hypothetical protein
MLDPADRLDLPDGVRLDGDAVVDDVRGERFAVNAAAVTVLQGAGETLAAAAGRLGAQWELSPEQARADVLSFAWSLYGALLANVVSGRARHERAGSWISLALRLLPAGQLPHRVARRVGLDTTTVARAVATGARAVLVRSAAIAAVVAGGLVHLWLLVGDAAVLEPVALGVSSGVGLLLHEVGHAAALVRVRAAIALAGRRTMVLHGPLVGARAALVALAGPLVPACLGAGLASAALASGDATVALVACPLGGHAVAVTVLCGDGRTACGL